MPRTARRTRDSVAVGDVFHRLTVTGAYTVREDGQAVFPVRCSCGTESTKLLKYLGQHKSCGCLQRERAVETHTRHGNYVTPRSSWLWRTYGLTVEQFDTLYDQQLGRCAICKTTFAEQGACVDHCHTTGAVRGLLCRACNVGLGAFYDDTETMKSAIRYIEETR